MPAHEARSVYTAFKVQGWGLGNKEKEERKKREKGGGAGFQNV